MDEHSTDDEFRALRAADPAAGVVTPDALRGRIAEIPEHEAVPMRAPLRRRQRWVVPVAAASAVIAAIGGGYVWGMGGIDLGPAPAPLAVQTGTPDDPAAPVALGGGSTGNPSGSLPGHVNVPAAGTAVDTAASVVHPYGLPSPRQRFSVPDFETAPAQASVYAVDGRVRYSAEDAGRMAAMLGITGDARRFDEGHGGWIVGDHLGAHLSMDPWSGGAVQYSSGIEHPWAICHRTVAPRYSLDNASQDVVNAYNDEVMQCVADTPLPTDQQVRDAVRSFLAATGVDEEATQITVVTESKVGSGVVAGRATWLVQNNATELFTEVSVSSQGILHGYGPTGQIVSLGDYAIVSPAEAAARLNDPAYSPRLVSWPAPAGQYAEYSPTGPTAPPELPSAGSAVPWPVAEHEIVSGRLGVALHHGPNGEQYLAPAYEFTASDETVWSVIALAEDDLDTTATDPGYGWYGGWW